MIQKCWIKEYTFQFLREAKTSRNSLSHKTSFFICLCDEESNVGHGECSPIYGLSLENEKDLRIKLKEVERRINNEKTLDGIDLTKYPSIRFALESAERDLNSKGKKKLFNTSFTRSETDLKINGLIWMGDMKYQISQVEEKVKEGFNCIKIKIGSLSFEQDLEFIKYIRTTYGYELELRLDANGAFDPKNALEKLNYLSEYSIHSIEQPIKQGQLEYMSELIQKSPIDVALDEELIGIRKIEISKLLDTVNPKYIILKPSLIGGFNSCNNWVKEAEKRNIQWWATSFLESNIGLNAIAQWVSQYDNPLYQGLGTGKIYSININSPLELKGENLHYNSSLSWDTSLIENNGQALL